MADTDIHELVEEKTADPIQDTVTIDRLFEFLEDKNNPWRSNWLDDVVVKCYKYKELDQWTGEDKARLSYMAVPPLAVDRINRGRDTILGMRSNTNIKKKIVKRELGDEIVAGFLDKVMDYVIYNSDVEATSTECFESMIDTGRGVRKIGWDQNLNGGLGE